MIVAWRTTTDAPAEVRAVELARPALQADDVLVRVDCCLVDAAQLPSHHEARTAGSAAIGEVVDTGSAGDHLQGRRVLVGPVIPCGQCETCRSGAVAVCPDAQRLGIDRDGTLASHVVAHARWVCPIDDIPLQDPTLGPWIADPLARAYEIFISAGTPPGVPVVVIGDNLLAKLVDTVATAKGAHAISVPEHTLPDALRNKVKEKSTELELARQPVRIFECSRTRAGRQLAINAAWPGATIVFDTTFEGANSADSRANVQVDMTPALASGCKLVGVVAPHPDLLTEVAALACELNLRVIFPEAITTQALPEIVTGIVRSEVPYSTLAVVVDAQ